MIDNALLDNFLVQFDGLRSVVIESAGRAIEDPHDALFYDNQNVFIKAYLVSACSMLEAFIQDLAYAYVEIIQNKIKATKLPFNMVIWVTNHDKAKPEFKPLISNKVKKDISDLISPNYYKTIKAFEKIGIDLSDSDIESFKDLITSRVEKRNKIVHHNDDALDLSFRDVVDTIDNFKEYSVCLFNSVNANPYISAAQ